MSFVCICEARRRGSYVGSETQRKVYLSTIDRPVVHQVVPVFHWSQSARREEAHTHSSNSIAIGLFTPQFGFRKSTPKTNLQVSFVADLNGH